MHLLDLAAVGLLAGGASYLAANHASGTFRLPIVKGKDSFFNDWRTVIGLGSLLALPFTGDKSMARHAFGVLGMASLASVGSTEAMRYVTVKRAAALWGSGAPGASALPGPAGSAGRPFGAPVAALPAPGASPANPIPVAPVASRVGYYPGFGAAAA